VKREFITKQWTFWGYTSNYIWPIFITLGIMAHQESVLIFLAWALAVLAILCGSAYFVRTTNARLRNRDAHVADVAQRHKLHYEPLGNILAGAHAVGSVRDIHGARNQHYNNMLTGDDWQYCDYSYDLYNKTKHGEYKAATVHYGVMSTKLPRILPNVFFDSIKARRRQFRFHFARSQRHRLEGGFEKYFVTYFPEEYTIDSMSFISPEVMWALKEASDYDIEIAGDRLFLYGPLYEPEAQIADMAAKIKEIKRLLLNNIVTYRDQRLPFEEGRKRVSAKGISLRGSKFWKIVSAATVILYIIGRIALEIWGESQ
jgi:hypothetical protein